MKKKRILNVVGARPNFVKIAPLIEAFGADSRFEPLLVHTGQHYDYGMSQVFFRDLAIHAPDYFLGVGSGSHGQQTAGVMIEIEKLLMEIRPDLTLVVGDVNSTLASALASAKLGVPLAHVEAGLRSFDETMPEEINRRLTDHVSRFLFTHCEEANQNLRAEGISEARIHFVGNVMIDTLIRWEAVARKRAAAGRFKLRAGEYVLLTLHRPSNEDNEHDLMRILESLVQVSIEIPVLWPVHPRVRAKAEKILSALRSRGGGNLMMVDPIGYLDFLSLMCDARLVLTDSGGIQEETCFLGIPCLTLRERTERSVTVRMGTNQVIGTDPSVILAKTRQALQAVSVGRTVPALWDGSTAERILKVLSTFLSDRRGTLWGPALEQVPVPTARIQ